MTREGTRVLAIRNADETEKKLYVFGYGVYEGNFPRPDMPKTPSKSDEDMIRSIIVKGNTDESRSENRDWMRSFLAGQVAQDKMTEAEAEEKFGEFLQKEEEEHRRPVEERVQDVWLKTISNPRIKLDDGGYCWGFECWWGEAEQSDQQFEGYERIKTTPQFNEAE